MLGVSVDDQTNAYVKSVICEQVQASMVSARNRESKKETTCQQEFVLKQVPADGSCFWHCLCALQDFDTWDKTPRKDSGYAVHTALVQAEIAKVKKLVELVVQLSLDSSQQVQDRASEINASRVVDVSDIPWIAHLLKIRIRCTITKEAWGF